MITAPRAWAPMIVARGPRARRACAEYTWFPFLSDRDNFSICRSLHSEFFGIWGCVSVTFTWGRVLFAWGRVLFAWGPCARCGGPRARCAAPSRQSVAEKRFGGAEKRYPRGTRARRAGPRVLYVESGLLGFAENEYAPRKKVPLRTPRRGVWERAY